MRPKEAGGSGDENPLWRHVFLRKAARFRQPSYTSANALTIVSQVILQISAKGERPPHRYGAEQT